MRQVSMGVPLILTWLVGTPSLAGGTPGKGPGTSGSIMGWRWGTPPRKDMGPVEVLWDGDGVNPSPPGVDRDTCEHSTFQSYYVTTYACGNKEVRCTYDIMKL